jgi:hypothetical protein
LKLSPLALAAAASALLLSGAGCGREGAAPDGLTGQPPAGAGPTLKPSPDGGTVPPPFEAAAVAVGVRPVPDTPVAALPQHVGHLPLTETGVREPLPALTPAPEAFTRELWVGRKGSDTAPGTRAAPFRTITRALREATPGTRVHVGKGTYAEKVEIGAGVRDGEPGRPIVLQGEGGPVLVPEAGTPGALVDVSRRHWVVDGFEVDVKGAPRFAVTFSGSVEGSMLVNSHLHSGSAGAGVTTYGNARGVTIENNHIHHFSRGDDDSHGVVVQTTSRDVTVRGNDIHHNSGDSVQCLGPEGFNDNAPAAGVRIEGNHFYANRENAVDIKTCHDVVVRANRMHGFRPVSSSKGDAVVVHYSARNVRVEDNDIWDAAAGISVGGNREAAPPSGVVVRRNRIRDIVLVPGGFGHGIRVDTSTGTQVLHNTLARIAGPGLSTGSGSGGPTENASFRFNLVEAAVLASLGPHAPGLRMDGNLYGAGRPFRYFPPRATEAQLLELAQWKALGVDADSQQAPTGLDPERLAPGAPAVDRASGSAEPFCGAAPDVGAVETGC